MPDRNRTKEKKQAPNGVPLPITSEILLETMAEGVVVLDKDGNLTYWNSAMSEITGHSREEAQGKNIAWLSSPDCLGSAEILSLLLERGDAALQACECRVVGCKGEVIPVLVNARSIRNAEQELLGILLTFTDFRPVCRLREEVQALQTKTTNKAPESFHGLVGKDPKMQELYRLLELAATSDATVLILGESGTGKELAASAIHRLSRRNGKPFVRVNCGALSETILESELFGHVKGAFTGAYQDRVGRFEAAHGGTLFLDEIGEISTAMQVKLLRVLQERSFEPVGSVETHEVDIRVIAATNRDLAAEVRAGRFREDLYYRLRVFPLHLPPLRERLDDLPLLIHYFVQNFSQRTGKEILGLEKQAMRAVMDYCWPGNIRELENAIEYAFVTCQDDYIGLFDLPQELRRFELRREICNHHPEFSADAVTPVVPTRPQRNTIVRNPARLRELLLDCGWNKAEAARRLGISRTAVWKWMKQHQLPLEPPTDLDKPPLPPAAQ